MSEKRILYIQYTNPAGYPPLEHSSHILAEAGWQVLFLGIALKPEMHLAPHPRIHVQMLPHIKAGWKQKAHYLYFALWVLGWVIRWKPRCIYASDALSAPAALLLTYLPGLNVIYHEHDSPDSTINASGFMRFTLMMRKRLAQRAFLNVLPNLERGRIFQEQTDVEQAPIIVWNCPRLEEVVTPAENNHPPLRLLYHGTVVPERLPQTVLDALAALPETVSLHVYGYETGNSGYIARLKQYAEVKGIAHRVHWYGLLSRHMLMRETHHYHVGLALLPKSGGDINLQQMIGASNKVFDYLGRGVPVLVNNVESWITSIVSVGYGRGCDPESPESIAKEIRWYLEHPSERQCMGKRGRAKILGEWNYEKQFHLLLKTFLNSMD